MNDEESKIMMSIINDEYNPNKNDNKSKNIKICAEKIHVSGIFYINEENWTIWINDVPYSSIGQHKDFSIDNVSQHHISLTLNNGDTLEIDI